MQRRNQAVRLFEVGDRVFVRNYPYGPKWLPGIVDAVTGPVSYLVVTKDGRRCRRHVDQLRSRSAGHALDSFTSGMCEEEEPLVASPAGYSGPGIPPSPQDPGRRDQGKIRDEAATLSAESGSCGSWSSYRVRLEAFFEGDGITDPGKKRALLVSALSDNVVRVLQGQCQSESVNSLSYEVVIQHLDNHFDPKANEIAASYAFFMRNQAEGEKVRDYITDLRRLAKDCSFEKFLDRMLRDRIVCGIRDEQALRHMLSQQKLSLAEVEAFSQAAEAAETNVRAMQERSFNDNGAANFVQKHRRNPQKSGRGHGSMTESTQCGRCGSNHGSEVCRHKKATCHKCGMKGHLARMCSRGRTNRSGTFAVKELDGSDGSSEDILYALEAHNNSRNLSARPFERDFIWEGRNLRMLVDTGSTIRVIPRRVFDNNREWWPPLEKTSLRRTCFLGPLPVLGRVAMKVECSNTQVDSSLVVVDCNGPLLCGQNTIQAFRKAGLALLEECASHERPENPVADSASWYFVPGDAVYVRNYGVGEKWTPGKVKSAASLVTVVTEDGVVQRYVDQIRKR
ncbi:hypothetical protein V5799_018295 [Amblyomma americanum]|uniref:CCHC-type domain-containing protein n=1 Tax=Amblyomma americanum TaxID=6943 RepID=A0AAQ4F0X0_AMBAM